MVIDDVTLLAFRSVNGQVAYMRDGGMCMYHLWLRNKGGVKGVETHHVFGRGHERDMSREHWRLRITLCQECHHMRHHGNGWSKADEMKALRLANERPRFQDSDMCTVEMLITIHKPELMPLFEEWRPGAEKLLEEFGGEKRV